jgi:primase-polymerase (primpol)-like protein
MPKKKQAETSSAPPSVARISCPACRSDVSSNGATLHTRSKYLEDLLETEADVEKLEKVVEGLEQKLEAARKELAAEKVKTAVQSKPGTNHATVGQGQTKQRGSWW